MNNLLDRLYWLGLKEVISRGEDRLSLLPEPLLCHILSFLTTREAVCTSVLSSIWRNLWQWVPRLELDMFDFPNDKACVGFINKFLLNVKSLSEFNLKIDAQDASLYEPCLDNVRKRKIQQFQVECYRFNWTPLTLPAREELVSLKLFAVRLNDFESLSLPCLKTLHLAYVVFPHNAVFDTPRLEHLSLIDYRSNSFKIVGMPASVKVHIDVYLLLDEFCKKNIIYNLLHNFLAMGDMTLSLGTLELIYCFRNTNTLPKFRDLTRLRATMRLVYYCLEILPFVLEMCPNLKHLTLELVKDVNRKNLAIGLPKVRSFCLVSSLEYVEIESPITEEATEQEVVKYFLGNARSLKKLVLRLNVSDGKKHDLQLLKQRFDSPRRSSSCLFEVLLVVQTPEKIKELCKRKENYEFYLL